MNTFIVALSGKQGSGKSSTAKALAAKWISEGIPTVTYKFAQPIYDMHDVLYLVAKDYGIEPPVGGKDKVLLQILGTEWGRETRGKNIWVRCAQRKIAELTQSMRDAGQFHVAVIDDMRFKNELSDMHADINVRIECDRDVRKERCDAWRDSENHPSEVDLDDSLAKFDMVVNSEVASLGAIVAAIDRECRKRFPAPYLQTSPDVEVVASNTVRISDLKPECR